MDALLGHLQVPEAQRGIEHCGFHRLDAESVRMKPGKAILFVKHKE